MLTRIEIDGFKSFRNLKVDLHPFTVIAGPNAAGKSNFFDALRFLSRIANYDLSEAVQELRGDPSELFSLPGAGEKPRPIKFVVEVLLDREIADAFSERKSLKYTRLRYTIEIERREETKNGIERLFVKHEEARIIRRKEDQWLEASYAPSKDFVKNQALYASGGGRSQFLETAPDRFVVNQDGVSGRPRPFPISRNRATASVLSRINTVLEFPHLFALRAELAGITFLQLEASAERRPSDALAPEELLPDGSNIAKVLARIEAETRTPERPQGDLTLIRNRLESLIGGVDALRVERDTVGRSYRLFVRMKDEGEFSSSVLSDGTLRLLALATYLQDPRRASVLLFEEPENGVHERRIEKLVSMLRSACTDVQSSMPSSKLYQVLINTHSPVVLNMLRPHEVVVADLVREVSSDGKPGPRRTRMRSGLVDELDLGDEASREYRLTRTEADRVIRSGNAQAAE
jgi:predicted ATPase